MREIKFRVWNKNRKMFIIDGMTPKEIQDDATQSMELPMMTSEDCIWQQYTGLKDKNGVEIYEGDIVEYFDWCYCRGHDNKDKEFEWEFENTYGDWQTYTYQPMIGEVSWNEDYQTYNPIVFSTDDYNGNCFANVCYDHGDFNKLNSKGKTNYPKPYYEVIGDIFEGVDK